MRSESRVAVLEAVDEDAGLDAQRKSIVLLENNGILPLKKESKIYIDGLDKNIGKKFGNVVNDPSEADVIIMYIHTVFNGNQESGLNRIFDNFLTNRHLDLREYETLR